MVRMARMARIVRMDRIEIDGPFSLFESVTSYGLRLALLLPALEAGEIDLILLDLTLSGGEDGVGLLRGLPFKPCPILIFTAEDESVMYGETWEKLRALGADDVVIKGMNVGESILRKVGSLVGQPIEDDDGDVAVKVVPLAAGAGLVGTF